MSDSIFAGKTLLVLGSNVGAADIVKYAKAGGAYTIVADYLPAERSAAKQLADEGLLISTADLDALGELVIERQVDGILAGISEFNILKAMTLSERFGLPFYCTKKQWDQVENKENFRGLCSLYGVPSPATYFCGASLHDMDLTAVRYPVIIKPVDACTSAGIHICMDQRELIEAEEDALSHSSCGRLIIEQYVGGTEFGAHYTIANGVPTLSCVDNRYSVAVHGGQVTTLPAARVFPSLFLEAYLDQVDGPMKKLCRGLGIQDGVLFIQGMYDGQNGFAVFEAGLRSAGEAPYRFIEAVNGINYMSVLVDHALTGRSVSFDSSKEDPRMKGKCCAIVAFVAKGGKVGAINGLEEAVASTPSVIAYENRYPVGSETPDGDTLRQLMLRFVMVCGSREQMAKDIAYLNENIEVLDDRNNEMVIKLEPDRLFGLA